MGTPKLGGIKNPQMRTQMNDLQRTQIVYVCGYTHVCAHRGTRVCGGHRSFPSAVHFAFSF